MKGLSRALIVTLVSAQIGCEHKRDVVPTTATEDIRRESKSTVYVFQLSDFDCSIEELYEEGKPYLYVKVQNKIGRIYQSDLGSPEW